MCNYLQKIYNQELQLITRKAMEELIENHIVKKLEKLFPETTLVEREKLLPNGKTVDLHLKNEKGEHIFVEIKSTRIARNQIGQLVDLYSAISNMEPSYRNSKLVVVGESIDQEAKDVLSRIEAKFLSLSSLGVSKKALLQEQKEQRLRLLTPLEADLVSKWEHRGASVLTVDDLVEETTLSRSHARTIIHRLVKKKWLERIKKGLYLFIPAEYGYAERFPPMDYLLVGSILVKPYYYSYSTSNAHYGFTTQVRPTVYIAALKARRAFMWRNGIFKFVKLREDKFFGYEESYIQDYKVHIASPEKSIVDSVDKAKYAGGVEEVTSVIYNALNRTISYSKLIDYAIKMRSYSLVQRMGFLIDFLAKEGFVEFPRSERDSLREHIGRAIVYLGSSEKYGKGGTLDGAWKVIQNVPAKRLLGQIVIR